MRKTNIIIGGILILITVLIFELVIRIKLPSDYISLGFVLFAEIAATVGMTIKKSSDLEAWSVSGILIGYMVICILFSIIFGRIMIPWLNIYLLIHILLIAVTAAAIFFAHGISKHNHTHNTKVMSQLTTMRECEAIIQTMYLNAEPKYRDELRKVYEAVKYVDKASDVNSADIMIALNDLKAVCGLKSDELTDEEATDKDKTIKELSQKVISLVNERIAYNTSLKHGNF